MGAREKVLDDVARMAGETIGVLSGVSRQMREEIRTRVDEAALKFDLVPREEFERLEAMLIAAREKQEEQDKRIDALEKQLKKTKT